MKKFLMITGSVLALSFYHSCNASLASQTDEKFLIDKDSDAMEVTSQNQKILEKYEIIEEEQEDTLVIPNDYKREAMKAALKISHEMLGLNRKEKENYKK